MPTIASTPTAQQSPSPNEVSRELSGTLPPPWNTSPAIPAPPVSPTITSFPPLHRPDRGRSSDPIRGILFPVSSGDPRIQVAHQMRPDGRPYTGQPLIAFVETENDKSIIMANVSRATESFRHTWEERKRIHGTPPSLPLPPPTEDVLRVQKLLERVAGSSMAEPLAELASIILREPREYFDEFAPSEKKLRIKRMPAPVSSPPNFTLFVAENKIDRNWVDGQLLFSFTRGEGHDRQTLAIAFDHQNRESSRKTRALNSRFLGDIPDAYRCATPSEIQQFVDLLIPEVNRTLVFDIPNNEFAIELLHGISQTI